MDPAYHLPGSAAEAWSRLKAAGTSAVLLGGGTVAVPLIAGVAAGGAAELVDLSCAGLGTAAARDGVVRVGAMMRLSDVARLSELPALERVIRSIGSPGLRNLATVGGNLICRGDLATALLALGAEVGVLDDGGERSMTLEEFYASPPRPPCLVASVSVSRVLCSRFGYHKLGRTALNARPVVTAATARTADGGTRIALGGIGPEPMVLRVERDLFDGGWQADEWEVLTAGAGWTLAPGADSQASGWYRARVIPVAVARAIADARPFA